jgi:hypothetical protein
VQLLVTRRWHEVGKLPDRDRLLWLIKTYYLCVCVCVCARARACVCMFVLVRARVRVYMCVCIYICMYACIRMYVYIHTYIHIKCTSWRCVAGAKWGGGEFATGAPRRRSCFVALY